MGHFDSYGPASSGAPPPPWWTVDGADIPLESLETGPLPDKINADTIKKLHEIIRRQARELRLTRERLDQELRHRYGSSSEKRPSDSGTGKDESTNQPPAPGSDPAPDLTGDSSTNAASADPPAKPKPKGKKPGHGRRPIPPDLPRDTIHIPPDGQEEDPCQRCGGAVHHVGDPVESYRFDYVPGHIRVRVLVRFRCACDDPTCDAPFSIVPLPPEPIPKSRATAGFLAHLLVTKFADHCPLYRFRKILLRQKVDLPLSTLVDYCAKATTVLKPLWQLMKERVLLSAIVQTDDTKVRARLPRKKGVLKGHLWAYKGDSDHPYVVFEFTDNWKAEAPQEFLKSFCGYVQADGYKGYDKLFEKDSTGIVTRFEVGCWSHARRKWVKAQASSPTVANVALEMIGQLFAVETETKEMSPDERKRIRQERSTPVLETFRVWMEEQKCSALPKSPVAAAIEYAQNQWTALLRYLDDGRLAIDNNAVERELRGVALGRKNWLAAGSEVGGETAAIAYTMISSAVLNGVNPVVWLTDVLERIITLPQDRLVELLPDKWKAAHPDEIGATDGTPPRPAGGAGKPAAATTPGSPIPHASASTPHPASTKSDCKSHGRRGSADTTEEEKDRTPRAEPTNDNPTGSSRAPP